MKVKKSRWKILIEKLQEAKKLLPSAPRFGSSEYLRYRKFLGSIILNNDCSRDTRNQFNKLNPYSEPETFKNWGNAIRGLRHSLPHLRDECMKNIGAESHAELEYTTQKIEFALGQLEERFPLLYFDCLLSHDEQKMWYEDNLAFIQQVEDEFNLLETHEPLTLPPMGKETPNQKESIPLDDQFLYLQQKGGKEEKGLWFRLESEQVGFKRLLLEKAEMRIIRYLYDVRFDPQFALKREEIGGKLHVSGKSVGTRIAKIRVKCNEMGMRTELIVNGPSPATWMLDQKLDCCSPHQRKIVTKKWAAFKRK